MENLKQIQKFIISNKYYFIGATALFILLIIIIVIIRKSKYKLSADNEDKIKELHPEIRSAARQFITNAKKAGYDLRITSALRTWKEQAELYAQGRTKPGAIVTNANAGDSYHNYGLALDVVDRKLGYNTNWSEIGKIGKKAGFEWGGDWKSFSDKPHFQITFGYKTSQLKPKYIENEYINL